MNGLDQGFVVLQQASQLADAHVEPAAGCFNRLLRPEEFNELFAGHHFPPVDDQDLANGLGLVGRANPAHSTYAAGDTHFEMAQ